MSHVRTRLPSDGQQSQTLAVFEEPANYSGSRSEPPSRYTPQSDSGRASSRARARLGSPGKPTPVHAPEMRSLPNRSVIEDRQHALRRGRRVIRRGRSEDSDGSSSSVTEITRTETRRRVSFRARMHYDLVVDRTATIRRGRGGPASRNGKLTLITTRKVLQRGADGRPPSLSECVGNVEDIVVEDVMVRVNAYNANSGRELIWVTVDGTALEGYVDVQLKLNNPIHVLHLGESSQQQGPRKASLKVMYFANCHRTLLISSDTTVAEMIEQLIAAYRVVDQPVNFALHECRKGKQYVGRILDIEERPLLLSLLWGANSSKCMELREVKHAVRMAPVPVSYPEFGTDSGIASSAASTLASVRSGSLQIPPESEPEVESPKSTSTINWIDFTVPELNNFLKMLANEEERQKQMIESRFEKKRNDILEKMHEMARQGLADVSTPYGTLV